MGLFKSPEKDWKVPARAQGALSTLLLQDRFRWRSALCFLSTLIRRNTQTLWEGQAWLSLGNKRQRRESWVCFSCGSRCSPHILLSLLEPGLKGYRTLAILKLQPRNGCSTGAWKPGPKCLYKQLHAGHPLPGVWPACPFHPCSVGHRVHIHVRNCFCCFLLLERTCSIIRGRRAEALHSPWLPPCKLHLIIVPWLLRNLGAPRPPHCLLEGAGSDFCFVLGLGQVETILVLSTPSLFFI